MAQLVETSLRMLLLKWSAPVGLDDETKGVDDETGGNDDELVGSAEVTNGGDGTESKLFIC